MVEIAGLERAAQRGLQLALGVGGVERGAVDADPRAAAGSAGTHVGRDLAVGAEREPDQAVAGAGLAREHAGADRRFRIAGRAFVSSGPG